jgi:hypothetical protein
MRQGSDNPRDETDRAAQSSLPVEQHNLVFPLGTGVPYSGQSPPGLNHRIGDGRKDRNESVDSRAASARFRERLGAATPPAFPARPRRYSRAGRACRRRRLLRRVHRALRND